MWTTSRASDVCVDINIDYTPNKDWEQWGLLTADRHLDNPASNRELQKHHLEQAKERGAFVCDFGDLFDAMQGRNDRRRSKADVMSAHADSNYLNRLVEDAHKFFRPYAENLALIGEGNHETSVQKNVEYSLIDGLLYSLGRDNPNIKKGGYRGWVRFRLDSKAKNSRKTISMYYHHGHGGGGPVTRGVIQSNRQAVYLANADIVIGGHIHEQWLVHISRVILSQKGVEKPHDQIHARIPTYKDEFYNQSGGFHHETGKPPKPIGAWWIRFYYSRRNEQVEYQLLEAEL